MERQKSHLQTAFKGAFALASLTAAAVPAPANGGMADQKIHHINQVSLSSIEQSYLDIPPLCKARTAAFDPIPVEQEEMADSVAAVHNALDRIAV